MEIAAPSIMRKPLALSSISHELLQAIENESNRTFPAETGGILLGGYVTDTESEISQIVGPGPRAVHKSSTFIPDYEYQEAEIVRAYRETGGRIAYLGDWHSHPGGTGTPSWVDRQAMINIARSSKARCPQPLMLIVAGGPCWAASLWRLLNRTNAHIQPLTLRVDGFKSRGL